MSIIRTKIRNLRTGAIIPRNFLSGDRFQEAPVERRTMQYLYTDGEFYYFMDTETYDQVGVRADLVGDKAGYLKEGAEYSLSLLDNEPLDVELPGALELKIVDAEMGIAGDTGTGASKRVTCETGLKSRCPSSSTSAIPSGRYPTGEYVTRSEAGSSFASFGTVRRLIKPEQVIWGRWTDLRKLYGRAR